MNTFTKPRCNPLHCASPKTFSRTLHQFIQLIPRVKLPASLNPSPSEAVRPRNYCDLDNVDLRDFRERFFEAELPGLWVGDIQNKGAQDRESFPAQRLWFTMTESGKTILNREYIEANDETAELGLKLGVKSSLTYESTIYKETAARAYRQAMLDLTKQYVPSSLTNEEGIHWARFQAPWDAWFRAAQHWHTFATKTRPNGPHSFYIAQTPITDLSLALQADLRHPQLVQHSGRGDIYDSSIWIGHHPTDTPLHKDPNPNLFVQLSGRKHVRIMSPRVGRSLMLELDRRQRGSSCKPARSHEEEMMYSSSRGVLNELVWGDVPPIEEGARTRSVGIFGEDVYLDPGDALFIPKNWWHSVKSVDTGDVVASVNWWFR